MKKLSLFVNLLTVLCANLNSAQDMDQMWGENVVKMRVEDAARGQLFDEGNYTMFIHWGLYSNLANLYRGETYYGISECERTPSFVSKQLRLWDGLVHVVCGVSPWWREGVA